MSALTLCNLVQPSPHAQSERLNRFGEEKDKGDTDSEGGNRCDNDEDGDEDVMQE